MTLDEARAQFPVLERHAYLNAGSSGPLPQAVVDAVRARLDRDLTEGRRQRQHQHDREPLLHHGMRRGFTQLDGPDS